MSSTSRQYAGYFFVKLCQYVCGENGILVGEFSLQISRMEVENMRPFLLFWYLHQNCHFRTHCELVQMSVGVKEWSKAKGM